MRFAYTHKLSTYLAAGAAYFGLAFSGELGFVVLLLIFAGMVGSWFWEPPRVNFDRWAAAWTGLSIGLFLLSIFAILTGGEVLIVGAYFLMYLLVAKLFSRRTCRDYSQVMVLSFLMVVAGTVLNSGFSYGLFFLGYVVFTTWAAILLHLRREIEDNFLVRHRGSAATSVQVQRVLDSRRIVGGRFLTGTSVVSIAVFVSASILFLAIPRIGFGLFFNKKRSSIQMSGFSDGVSLGDHGTIKDDPTVVMRVKMDFDPTTGEVGGIHWRGVAFDRYENGQWRRDIRRAPRADVELNPGNTTRLYMRYTNHGKVNQSALAARRAKALRQEVYLEPLGSDVLFGASLPIEWEFSTSLFDPKSRKNQPRGGLNDEARLRHGAGVKYVVYSDVTTPEARPLAPGEDPLALPQAPPDPTGRKPTYDVYLQLPDSVRDSPRIRELAEQITSGIEAPYDKARAIETWLRTELSYTLEMRVPPEGQEPVDFFLFDWRAGHCEYFSSAMAIMLRTVGIPSRNVNGFLGGEWNEFENYVAVRNGDAHSWVEVYFADRGWVTFDPTPPGEANRLGSGGTSVLDKARRLLDTMRLKWFEWVIEYDLQRQLSVFRSIGKAFGGGSKSLKKGLDGSRDWFVRHKWTLGGLVAGIGIFVFVVLRLRSRRLRNSPLGAPRSGSRARSAVAGVWLVTARRMARRGHRRDQATTPREYADALARKKTPGAASFARLTELYYAAVYGPHELPDMAAQAKELRDQVETAWKQRPRR